MERPGGGGMVFENLSSDHDPELELPRVRGVPVGQHQRPANRSIDEEVLPDVHSLQWDIPDDQCRTLYQF